MSLRGRINDSYRNLRSGSKTATARESDGDDKSRNSRQQTRLQLVDGACKLLVSNVPTLPIYQVSRLFFSCGLVQTAECRMIREGQAEIIISGWKEKQKDKLVDVIDGRQFIYHPSQRHPLRVKMVSSASALSSASSSSNKRKYSEPECENSKRTRTDGDDDTDSASSYTGDSD